jgi:phosphopantetheinyl transferase
MDHAAWTIFWTRRIADAAASQQPAVVVLDLDDPALRPLLDLAPTQADLARVTAYGEAARDYFFKRHSLLRHLIALRLGCAAEDVVVSHDKAGAPQLLAPARQEALYLSLSGRGSFAALALASRPIGVDLEILSPLADVPEAMLHPNEQARLADLDAANRHKAFLEIWTLKEAYLKALRIGLSREPAEIDVAFEGAAIGLFDRGERVNRRACASRFELFTAATVIAACVIL